MKGNKMAMPEQARLAAERANELLSQINAPPTEPTPVVDVSQESQIELIPETTAAEPAPTPEAAPAPAPAPAPEPQEDFKQKYKTLQGMHDSLRRQSEQRVAALEEELRQARATPVPAPTAAPAPAAPTSRVTEKDMETYGADLLDLIDRKAEEVADRRLAAMRAEVQPQLEQTRQEVKEFGQQVYASKEEQFYGDLTKQVPDWQSVNSDPAFLNWLAEVDPLSGVARQQYMNNAGQRLDAAQAANLFNAFKAVAGIKPTTAAAPAPAPAPATRLSPSPRPAGAASAPTHAEPDKSISRSQIAAHYARSTRDQSYIHSDEHKAMELRIQEAMATNQVTEG